MKRLHYQFPLCQNHVIESTKIMDIARIQRNRTTRIESAIHRSMFMYIKAEAIHVLCILHLHLKLRLHLELTPLNPLQTTPPITTPRSSPPFIDNEFTSTNIDPIEELSAYMEWQIKKVPSLIEPLREAHEVLK